MRVLKTSTGRLRQSGRQINTLEAVNVAYSDISDSAFRVSGPMTGNLEVFRWC